MAVPNQKITKLVRNQTTEILKVNEEMVRIDQKLSLTISELKFVTMYMQPTNFYLTHELIAEGEINIIRFGVYSTILTKAKTKNLFIIRSIIILTQVIIRANAYSFISFTFILIC